MEQDSQSIKIDPCLVPLLETAEAAERDRILESLVSIQAMPIIRSILKARMEPFRSHDYEDACADVIVRLMKRLRDFQNDPDGAAIRDFNRYVAEMSRSRCNEYIRSKHAQWWRLKNRIRYLLTHDSRFELRETESGDWLCAISGRNRVKIDSARLRLAIQNDLRMQSTDLSHVVEKILRTAGGEVDLDELVTLTATHSGIRTASSPVKGEPEMEDLPDLQPLADERTEQRRFLEKLWSEIRNLPANQSAALLLNLHDAEGRDIIALFPLTGVASVRQIAELLGIPVQEFASLWNQLPLEDAVIATRLKISRQQVINLRKSARERLSRRLKSWRPQPRGHSYE